MGDYIKFKDSIAVMDPGDRRWGIDFFNVLQYTFDNSGDDNLYDLVAKMRYINTPKDIAYTDGEYIYLNATKGGNIGPDDDGWTFCFIHECLHIIWDTFGVGDEIKKELGSFNHDLLNIASDCVINDYVNREFKLDIPASVLVTPEYIKAEFGIEYDRKVDDQKSLYMKLLPKEKEILSDPKMRKVLDEQPPIVKIPPLQGGGGKIKRSLIETTQAWKDGHEQAFHEANEILKKCYASNDANDGDPTKVVKALEEALKDISKLKGKSSSYTHESIMSLVQHLVESIIKEAAAPQFQTFDQGWEQGLADMLEAIQNCINKITNPGPGPGPGPDHEIKEPDFNENEEEPLLPKIPAEGGSDDDDDNKKKRKGDDSTEEPGEPGQEKDKEGKEGKKDKEGKEGKELKMPDYSKLKKRKRSNDMQNDSYSGGKGSNLDELPGLSEIEEECERETRSAKEIIKDYLKRGLGGHLKGFFDKCKAASKGPGIVARSPKGMDRGLWAKEFMTEALNMMRHRIEQMEKEWKRTYARPNRRSGIAQMGMPLKRGRQEVKQGVTITMKFYVDVSGSMGQGGVDRCADAVWEVCDQIKKANGNNPNIKEFNCLLYPFNEYLLNPIKSGHPDCGGNNMDFDELLDCMRTKDEMAMLSVILTDAQWNIMPNKSIKILRDEISSNVIMITNNTSETTLKDLHEIERKQSGKFKVIPATQDWKIKW